MSPDLPDPILHDPDPMRIVRREGGTVTPDGGPLTTTGYQRIQQWRQRWLALPQQVIPAVVSPSGTVHFGADGLRFLAGIAGSPAIARDTAPGLPSQARRRHEKRHRAAAVHVGDLGQVKQQRRTMRGLFRQFVCYVTFMYCGSVSA
jgi:hypothetical protein